MSEKAAGAAGDILFGTAFYLTLFGGGVWFLNSAFVIGSILAVATLVSLILISAFIYFLALWYKLTVVASGKEVKS